MKTLSSWISLFASTGTLVCCALPSLLVALGMGAAMAGLVTALPQIVWLSQYKLYVFAFSGVLILASAYLQWYTRNQPCPIDPKQARACRRARKLSIYILVFSGGIWILGAAFAFVAPWLND